MPIDIKKIKAICFDIDGTLSDTDDQMVAQAQRWLFPLRVFVGPDRLPKLARRLVMALESPANLLYEWLDRLNLDRVLADLMSRFAGRGFGGRKKFLLIPGVRKMLEEVSVFYPLAIVSARDESTTLQFLEKFELKKYFKVIVTSQTCAHTKPFPKPIFYAAEKLGVKPQACLMVGDTTVDIKTGKRAGAQTVGVLCGFGSEKELAREGADIILKSSADLKDLLK